ncbi:hypothetical protein Tco_0226865 [Tanacetum coccineum]
MPTFSQPNQSIFSQPAFSQPAFSQPAFSQPNQPTQTNQTGQQYPNNVQSQQFQQFQTATISANNVKFPYLENEKIRYGYERWSDWIHNADHNHWRLYSKDYPKRLGRMLKEIQLFILLSLYEHVSCNKGRITENLVAQALS